MEPMSQRVPTAPVNLKRGHYIRGKRARWWGQWWDAKGFRLSLLEGDRIVHLLRWHQVHTEEQPGEALRQVTNAGAHPAGHVRLCVVADGAEWIGKHVQTLFLQARQGLADRPYLRNTSARLPKSTMAPRCRAWNGLRRR